MTIDEFNQYKTLSDKVIDLLIKEKHSSLKDIKIIYNIIMGFPYCLDREGQYTYNGKFYNSLDELPDEAKKDVLYQACADLKVITQIMSRKYLLKTILS